MKFKSFVKWLFPFEEEPFEGYFGSNDIKVSRYDDSVYAFSVYLPEGRFQTVRFELIDKGAILDAFARLPVRVNRNESDEVLKGLMQINRELDEDCCYELNILSGNIHFHMRADMPEKAKQIAEIVDRCEEIISGTSDRLMDFLCRVIASGDAAQKIDFRKGRWVKGDGEATCTYDELKATLKTAEKQVVVLEGPSGCGKSTLIRELMDESAASAHLLPVDHLRDCIGKSIIGGSALEDLEAELAQYKLICIEDVDWALKEPYQQVEVGRVVKKFAENALVILDGVSCTKKNSTLLEMTQPTIYRFAEAPK